MADDINNQEPEGLDAFLSEQDPQGAVAAKGLGQAASALGQQLESGPAISKAPNEGIEPEDSPVDLLAGAAGAKAMSGIAPSVTDAIASGLSHSHFRDIVGNEVGQLGEKVALRAGQQLSNFTKKTGQTMADMSKSVPEYAEKSAENAAKRADALRAKKLGFEQGGYVNPDKTPFMADGGEISNEPEGLNAFLASNSGGDMPTTFAQSSPQEPIGEVPEGLDQFIAPEQKEAKYGTLGQQAIGSAEGAAQGLIGPFAPALETAAGVNPEDIRARAEVNPIGHTLSEAAGLIGPALLTGGASTVGKLTQLGALEAIGKKLGLVAGDTLASKIGVGAAKAAVDNMLISGSDEVSKMILNDPNQSAETALTNVGLSGALGSVLGGALPLAPKLWNETVGDKTGKIISDFRARVQQHVNNPDPVSAMTDELKNYHGAVTSLADEVYGPQGLKSQDIVKSMPEMHEGISNQMSGIYDSMSNKIDKMSKDAYSYPPRLVSKLKSDLDAFTNAITSPDVSPAEQFNAAQNLKQQLQGYSKFDSFTKPTDEAYDFIRDAKSLSHDIRSKLEDTDVWGDAAKRQQTINNAFKEYLPTLKDFEKRFTTKVAGEVEIDPSKVQTYLSQVGNPKAQIKQSMLKNFLDASEKYKKVIDQSHKNLGLESPISDSPMNVTLSSLEEKTLGSKLADAFINKGLSDAGAHAMGAGLGATLAHTAGLHGALGAIIGDTALTPFFKSVLPALAKSVLDKEVSPAGFRAAIEYGVSVAKGDAILAKTASSIFKPEAEVLSEKMIPGDKERSSLLKKLGKIRTNPDLMLNKDNPVQHYLPDNAGAMDQSVGNAITYLDQVRPNQTPAAPLDSKPPMSLMQKQEYNNALDIAEQPLLILDRVKKGTLTAKDLMHASALYPSFMQSMKNKVMESMTDHIAKGGMIPYKTRLGMSMLMGQPIDSTMSQQSIFAAQPIAPVPQPQQAPGKPKRGGGVKSAPALQKLPGAYQTPAQSRGARAQKI